jgi:hypothetical protein
MKILLGSLLSVSIAIAQGASPTPVLPRCNQPNEIAVTFPVSVAGSSFVIPMCVLLDPTATKIDTTTTPPTLRIVSSSNITPAGPVFVDGEVPIGVIDGVNFTFTLASPPNPSTALHLYRNGVRLSPGIDFSLTGAAIAFLPGAVPQASDTLTADYRK